ncbi:MAG: YggS family pyridoxal phosphate-dependent enzyme [Cyanobacteria bacterium J06648_11]
MNAELITTRIANLQQSIPANVTLMGVSKGVSADEVRVAYAAGLRHFGESRIQEAEPKQAELSDLDDISWHLIGHLQTNKAKKALQHFDWIDSVDRLALAQRLHRLAGALTRDVPYVPPVQVCLQVKLAPDPNKYGWTPAELERDLPELASLSHIHIRGLMAILPMGCDARKSLTLFRELHDLRDRLQSKPAIGLDLPVLSMGMSGDYQQAIAAGATIVRVGRGIFR